MTNTVFKKTTVAVALVAAGIALGWGVSQWRIASSHPSGATPPSAEAAKADRKVLYWYDPMGANAEVRQARQVALHGHGAGSQVRR